MMMSERSLHSVALEMYTFPTLLGKRNRGRRRRRQRRFYIRDGDACTFLRASGSARILPKFKILTYPISSAPTTSASRTARPMQGTTRPGKRAVARSLREQKHRGRHACLVGLFANLYTVESKPVQKIVGGIRRVGCHDEPFVTGRPTSAVPE